MATGTCEEVGLAYGKLNKLVKAWGSPLRAPYMTLSFMALLVIPELKLGPPGLFDVNQFAPVAVQISKRRTNPIPHSRLPARSTIPLMPSTLLEKVWRAHAVRKLSNGQTQLFVGLHLIHEVTSPQAFDMVRQHG